jgi:hypothetical protein
MPQFDASSIVEPLQCKLRPYADFDDVIPEPSDQQVGVFLAGLKKVMTEANEKLGGAKDVDVTDREQVMAAIEELEPDDFVQVADEMAAIHAALCSGRPSKAEILSVPLRRRNAFYNWLQGEVLNPEAAPGAGNGQAS